VSAPFRFPKFFVTNPSPCPYLPGKVERKVFTELTGRNAGELNDALGRIGFRRSQSVAYRPSCVDCTACVSVRVLAAEFKPTASQRKLLRRHADLEVTACKPWTTEEQYDLLRRYLARRHPGGGMAEMDESDFADMVEQTPVRTFVIEYREPSGKDGTPGKLVGACLTDQQSDGLSMIYSFFDVDPDGRKGLGTYIILDHIIRAARAGLPTSISAIGSKARRAWPTRPASARSNVSAATAGADGRCGSRCCSERAAGAAEPAYSR
jgi:arginine-tRNA-protein transferase